MFPHTVTVFNVTKEKDKTIYHRQVVSDVFFHVQKIVSQEGKGEKYTYAYNVIFSHDALKKYVSKHLFENKEDTYTLRENDIIVFGEFEQIDDLIDIQKSNIDYFLIKTVSENLYGNDELQNAEVTNWR